MPESIKTYDFKPGLSAEIELAAISAIFQQHQLNIIKPHRTDFYHIFWFTQGTPVHTVDFIPITLKPSTLLFINKNRVHFFDQTGNYDGWVLLFTDAFFARNTQDAQFLRNTILFHDLLEIPTIQLDEAQTDLTIIFQQMQHELAEPNDPVHASVLQNLVHNLLLLADRERRRQGFTEIKKGPDLDHTLHFTELMEKQFIRLRSVNQYAQQIGITERRLQQAIAKSVGKTPKQLIEERVLLEAKRLLVHTNQSIKEIGFMLGFDEPSNFSRFFRQQIGQTPAEFRKSFIV
ncbi:AraC family transcriptional regulator [Spirosoma endbachense]|uniref:Helix-turn-helix domain-containing protein n=1 Tax=Spirosoma endbachense TaxID=2666025 RepID=A0A6P1VQ47_9BACT|nr:AraC family transcriptional regulator [Spirosoma endbachense]QHV94242.1 helix-turn-helix domain-containing protein [Spirosoma endbachense]